MAPTLFHIPDRLGGWPVFGAGWLLAVWAVVFLATVGYAVRKHGLTAETVGNAFVLLLLGGVIYAFLPALVVPGRGLPIRGYGVMMLIAVVTGVSLARIRAKQAGFHPEVIMNLAFWLFAAGIVGGRVFYVVEYWPEYRGAPLPTLIAETANFAKGGLVVFGAFFGAAAAFVVFCRRHRLPMLALADVIAPSLLIGQSIGRIGCFFSGCCYGGACTLPWAVAFPPESPVYMRQLETGQLPIGGLRLVDGETGPTVAEAPSAVPTANANLAVGDVVEAVNGRPVASAGEAMAAIAAAARESGKVKLRLSDPERSVTVEPLEFPARSAAVHPAQLYSAIDAALLFAVLWTFYPLRRRDGEVTALMLILHPISRFMLEIVRTDETDFLGTSLSISQNMSLGLFAAGVALWGYLQTLPRRTSPRDAA